MIHKKTQSATKIDFYNLSHLNQNKSVYLDALSQLSQKDKVLLYKNLVKNNSFELLYKLAIVGEMNSSFLFNLLPLNKIDSWLEQIPANDTFELLSDILLSKKSVRTEKINKRLVKDRSLDLKYAKQLLKQHPIDLLTLTESLPSELRDIIKSLPPHKAQNLSHLIMMQIDQSPEVASQLLQNELFSTKEQSIHLLKNPRIQLLFFLDNDILEIAIKAIKVFDLDKQSDEYDFDPYLIQHTILSLNENNLTDRFSSLLQLIAEKPHLHHHLLDSLLSINFFSKQNQLHIRLKKSHLQNLLKNTEIESLANLKELLDSKGILSAPVLTDMLYLWFKHLENSDHQKFRKNWIQTHKIYPKQSLGLLSQLIVGHNSIKSHLIPKDFFLPELKRPKSHSAENVFRNSLILTLGALEHTDNLGQTLCHGKKLLSFFTPVIRQLPYSLAEILKYIERNTSSFKPINVNIVTLLFFKSLFNSSDKTASGRHISQHPYVKERLTAIVLNLIKSNIFDLCWDEQERLSHPLKERLVQLVFESQSQSPEYLRKIEQYKYNLLSYSFMTPQLLTLLEKDFHIITSFHDVLMPVNSLQDFDLFLLPKNPRRILTISLEKLGLSYRSGVGFYQSQLLALNSNMLNVDMVFYQMTIEQFFEMRNSPSGPCHNFSDLMFQLNCDDKKLITSKTKDKLTAIKATTLFIHALKFDNLLELFISYPEQLKAKLFVLLKSLSKNIALGGLINKEWMSQFSVVMQSYFGINLQQYIQGTNERIYQRYNLRSWPMERVLRAFHYIQSHIQPYLAKENKPLIFSSGRKGANPKAEVFIPKGSRKDEQLQQKKQAMIAKL